MSDPALRPLCFGAVTFFAQDSSRCQACVHVGDCKLAVAATAQALVAKYNIADVMQRHREAKQRKPRAPKPASDLSRPQAPETGSVVSAPAPTVPTLVAPKLPALDPMAEVRAMTAKIDSFGGATVVREQLARGVNPFDKSNRPLFILGELLIHKRATLSNVATVLTKIGVSSVGVLTTRAAFINTGLVKRVGEELVL